VQARTLFDEWKTKGNAKKVSWADPKPEAWAYASLPDAPGVVAVVEKGGAVFAAVAQPGAGIFYVALTPINGPLEWLGGDVTKVKGRRIVRASGKRGEVVGFAWEWGDDTTDPRGFGAFQSAVLSRADRFVREDAATIRYAERTGRHTLRARFGTAGTYTEPEYDWGLQPDWPSGEGHGRVPSLWVNGEPIEYTRDRGLLFDGPRLRLPRGGRLNVRGA